MLCKHIGFEVKVDLFRRFYSIKKHVLDKGWFYFSPKLGPRSWQTIPTPLSSTGRINSSFFPMSTSRGFLVETSRGDSGSHSGNTLQSEVWGDREDGYCMNYWDRIRGAFLFLVSILTFLYTLRIMYILSVGGSICYIFGMVWGDFIWMYQDVVLLKICSKFCQNCQEIFKKFHPYA